MSLGCGNDVGPVNRKKELLKNTAILSIGTFLPKAASFFTLPILTAYLTKEQYGTYDLISILASLLLPVTTLQIHTAAFRFLIEQRGNRSLARKYLSNILVFVVPVSVITLLLLFVVIPVNDLQIKAWIVAYLFFDTILCEIGQVARGLARNIDYSISAVISSLTLLALAAILVGFLGMGLDGAVISLALSPVLALIYLVVRLRAHELFSLSEIDASVLKDMLSYSWPMVPNNLSGWVMRVSDRFVVTLMLGVASNAVYAVANKIPSLLTLAQTTFAMAWQENASIASKEEDAAKYYSHMFSTMSDFYAGCLGLLIAVTPLLFPLVIKGDYWDAYEQMPLLFLSMFFYAMASFLGGIYIALKATKSVGITTIMAAACNIITDLALIRFIGIYAASISTLVSYFALFAYRAADVGRLVDIKIDYLRLTFIVMLLVIEAALFYINSPIANVINASIAVVAACYLVRPMALPLLRKIKKATS